MKKIVIKKIEKKDLGGEIRVEVLISKLDKEQEIEQILWYEVEKKYEDFICCEKCDSVVVSIFLTAMKFGFEIIQSYIPISEKLYYNLTYHVIPQIYEVEKGEIPLVSIEAEQVGGRLLRRSRCGRNV